MKRGLFVGLAHLLLLATASWADVVELRNGERIQGKLQQATPERVTIEVGGQTVQFASAQVRAIYFGAAPSAPPRGSTLADAISALRTLHSATTAGITYRDYSTRVGDTKAKADQYLRDEAGDEVVKTAIRTAVQYYVIASAAWSAKIRNDLYEFTEIGTAVQSAKCSLLKQFLAKIKADRGNSEGETDDWMQIAQAGIPVLWSCAGEDLAEAERLAKGR